MHSHQCERICCCGDHATSRTYWHDAENFVRRLKTVPKRKRQPPARLLLRVHGWQSVRSFTCATRFRLPGHISALNSLARGPEYMAECRQCFRHVHGKLHAYAMITDGLT